MPLGFSFAPGSDIQMTGDSARQGKARGLSPQQAVKILSLRVPEALPSNAPVNRSLLTSPGGAAGGAGGLQSLIQQLIQSFKPGGPGQSMLAGPTAQPAQPGLGGQGGSMEPRPPRAFPGDGGQGGMTPNMPTPEPPTPFQAFPNRPELAPQPFLAPHITWGYEAQQGPAPPLALGQNPDEIELWSRMFGHTDPQRSPWFNPQR